MEHTTYTHNGYSVEISWQYPGITLITVADPKGDDIISQTLTSTENPLDRAFLACRLVEYLESFQEMKP